ncbi:MAG: MFS transporter [Ruminococcaceae bacterium]|nr:MFS transporter [Oscillospiraceae bacterium]
MKKNAKLSKSLILNVILFGFMGQVAWAVENNFFNLFLFNEIGGDSTDISNMVAASSIVAVLTTLFMGSLSDKINKRKIFICGGYIIWGITVMAFAFISPENVAKIMGTTPVAAIATTVTIVIVMDCIMTFMGSTSNDAAFNAWITDITSPSNRAKTESLLALLPVIAMVVVTAAFGALSGRFGYPACFIGLGLIVSACGIIGIFSIKDSRTGIKSTSSFIECLTYGFKPSVIKSNKSLYISLICMGIFSIASQIFFPYLFIYVAHYIDMETLKLTVPTIILAVVVIAGAVAALVSIIILSDKKGKAPFLFPSAAFFVIGLVLVYFADKNIIWFALSAVIAMVGYGLLMIMINAAVRDFTPEDKAGQLQGIRMIFSVLLPMLIGPRIAAKITDIYATAQYANDYGEMVNIPAPHIYLAAAITGALIVIPLIFLSKEFKKQKSANN